MKRFSEWADPDTVGQSEYRAIWEHARDVMLDNTDSPAKEVHRSLESSLLEMRRWIDFLEETS